MNSDRPISVRELRGQVTLLFVWDFSCINSLRALPLVQMWHERYSPLGVAVIGIHTPRFAFGAEMAQLEWALYQYDIRFPILPDNEFRVWQAYGNTYWPTFYLIDEAGYVRYRSEGAGSYEDIEAALQHLLRDVSPNVDLPPVITSVDVTDRPRRHATRELRAGLEGGALGNREGYASTAPILYQMPSERAAGAFYVSGAWQAGVEYFVYQGQTEGLIHLHYEGSTVYAVLSPHADIIERVIHPHPVDVEVWQDDLPLTDATRGADLTTDGRVIVDRPRLYELVRNPRFGQHELTLRVRTRGFALFAFMFESEIA